MRRSFGLLSAVVIACASPACRDADATPDRGLPPVEVEAPPPEVDLLVEAAGAVRSLRAGRPVPTVDDLVQRLSLVSRDDPARRQRALRLAGALLLERAEHRRDEAGRGRGRDFLVAALPVVGAAPSCEDAAELAALLDRVGARDRAGVLAPTLAACHPDGAAPVAAAVAPAIGARHRRVVIDPGHGGTDPGAIGPTGLREADVNLDVGRRLAERLATRYGFQVSLTRDRDVFVPLEQRAEHANGTTADLFVSIHCNAANNREARGISTFALEASPRVAARLTAREGELVDGDVSGSWDVSRILADLSLSRHGRDSVGFAASIQRAMLHDARLLYPRVDDMGVHPARFHVLVTARMPAVLVELSFISNLAEEQRLRADAYRDLLAGSIARAIDEHLPGGG